MPIHMTDIKLLGPRLSLVGWVHKDQTAYEGISLSAESPKTFKQKTCKDVPYIHIKQCAHLILDISIHIAYEITDMKCVIRSTVHIPCTLYFILLAYAPKLMWLSH